MRQPGRDNRDNSDNRPSRLSGARDRVAAALPFLAVQRSEQAKEMVLQTSDGADFEGITPHLSNQMKIGIANMMLAWGHYDSATTYWLAKTLGTPLDVASIMFGNMTTEMKLTKLKTIFEHYGMEQAAAGLKQLQASHMQRVRARNTVAHSRCVGTFKNEPDEYVFSAISHIKGDPGVLGLTIIPYDEVLLCARFAYEAAEKIMELAAKSPRVIAMPNAEE